MKEYIVEIEDMDNLEACAVIEGELIRCRDCRWYDERNRGCANMDTYMEPQDFCSLGERREE